MAEPKPCKECGVHGLIRKELAWNENGTISEVKDPDHRMLFCESDNLEGLFAEVEKIIGHSIEKIIIESKSRGTKEYLEKMIPAFVRKLIYMFKPSLIAERMAVIGKAHGYGDIVMVEIKKHTEKGDYLKMTIENPYSIRFFRGDNLGGMEAASGRECTVKEEKTGENLYQLDIWVGTHPPELKERLKSKVYPLLPGSVEMDRCPSCGTPLAVSAHRWDMGTGIITDPATGTRKALYGPVGLDTVFRELEEELGEAIPETIIEAERRYVKEHFQAVEWLGGEEQLRHMIAVRGMGMLMSYEAGRERLVMTIRNPAIPYVEVGIAKGIFEMATGAESSTHTWSIADNGDLSIKVSLT
jgi:hypothetical protein